MRLHEVAAQVLSEAAGGLCFVWANKWNTAHHGENHKVVHGVVTNAENRTFDHAWIEAKGKAFDNNLTDKNPMPIAKYRKVMRVRNVKEYDSKTATITWIRSRHHGPWHKDPE